MNFQDWGACKYGSWGTDVNGLTSPDRAKLVLPWRFRIELAVLTVGREWLRPPVAPSPKTAQHLFRPLGQDCISVHIRMCFAPITGIGVDLNLLLRPRCSMSFWSTLRNRQPNRTSRSALRSRLSLESLDERALPSNTYAFLGSAAGAYGLLAFNNGDLSMVGQSGVIGNVGVGNNVDVTGRNSSITGTLFAANNAHLHLANNFQVSGGVVRQNMAQAINDAVAASTALGNLAATRTFTDVTNSLTLVGNGGMNVIRMRSLDYRNDTLTLRGGAMDVFVINVRNDFDFRNSHIVLQGVSADHVIFNFTSNGSNVLIRNANSDVAGTFLNPRGSVDYQNAATFQGAIFARTVSMHVNADLDNGTGGSGGGGGSTASLTGVVFNDSSGDGFQQVGEDGISGATLHLTGVDNSGNAVNLTAVTDSAGAFSFTGLSAGTYTLTEDQPVFSVRGGTLWDQGINHAGSAGGDALSVQDVISNIVLGANTQAIGYTFGEVHLS
jgi:hypothetical protein